MIVQDCEQDDDEEQIVEPLDCKQPDLQPSQKENKAQMQMSVDNTTEGEGADSERNQLQQFYDQVAEPAVESVEVPTFNASQAVALDQDSN